jgi:LPXTG-motif cell wall-anchored protein
MILSTSLRRRRVAAGSLTLGAGLMAFGVLAPMAEAASVEPVAYDGNPACPDGLIEFKIDDIVELPDNGTYTADTLNVEIKPDDAVLPAGFTIELDNVTGGANATFDWAAYDDDGDFPIDIVLVKAGNGGNQYTYPAPGAVSDTGLVSPKPSISHISFCFDVPETSDDGGTDNPSLDDGGTDDPTTTDDGSTDDVGGTTGSVDDGGTDYTTTDDGGTDDPTTTDDVGGTTGTVDDGGTDDPTTTDDVGGTTGTVDDGGTDDPTTTDDVAGTTGTVDDGGTGTEVKGRTVTRPGTEVLGRTTLPATGAEDHSLILLGGALILAGFVSLVMSREVLTRS